MILILALPAAVRAEVHVSATIEPAQAVIGDPIRYRITVETDSAQPDAPPAVAAWGGLTPRGGPVVGSQMSMTTLNGAQSIQYLLTYDWNLLAVKPGRYAIGPAQVTVGGKVYNVAATTFEIAANSPAANIPAEIKGESIMSARTEDANINRQLDGNLFLRVIPAKKTLTIREPLIVTYLMYNGGLQLSNRFEAAFIDIPGVLRDELYSTNRFSFTPVQLGGRQFQVAQMYRVALTPTKAGKITINGGYQARVWLPVRRRNDPFNDPFFSSFMDDPFFGGGSVRAEMLPPPIELDVQPLPTAGQPAGFSGTVGDFTLTAAADRAKLTTDDLVTLRLTVEGKGAIDLAFPPAFPKNGDFQVVGQNAKPTEKANTPDGIGGRKTFEVLLRPGRVGELQIPEIRYPIYNPTTARYVDLATPAIPVKVEPGKVAPAGPQSGDAAEGEAAKAPAPQLRYLHAIGNLNARRAEPLIESWVFWAVQFGAAGLMLGAWKRQRRIATTDPARQRRDGAWRRFDRALRTVRQRQPAAPPQELAGELSHAARAYIGDRFNVLPDGLTRIDIERLLLDRAIPEARVQRLCNLLESCEALRYAPVGAADSELGRWMGEIETIFKENLRE